MTTSGLRRFAPVATVFLLAPLIGEVLFGAIPLSRLPFGLLGVVGLYGGGAILVREAVRRRRLGAAWLVVLGLAYGLIEEGTVLQSLFDQHYPGLDFLGSYGHWLGVNWVWLEFIVPYHAVFSIAIPVVITELLFPEQRDEAWVSSRGLLGVVVVFVTNAVLLARFQIGLFTSHAPQTSLGANVGVALVAAGLIACALLAPTSRVRVADRPAASQRTIRLAGVLSGLAWFVGLRVLLIGDGKNAPAAVILLAGAAIAALAWWSIARVCSLRRAWGDAQAYALVSGALPTSWLLGFVIAAVSGGNVVVNLIGQVLFGVLLFRGLSWLGAQVRRRASVPTLPSRSFETQSVPLSRLSHQHAPVASSAGTGAAGRMPRSVSPPFPLDSRESGRPGLAADPDRGNQA